MTALLGTNGNERQQASRELAAFVDEGRHEPRRAEFSGEVTRELSRSIRRVMGAGVELCYPVLGPDDFVRNALVEQVKRHNTRRSVPAELNAAKVVRRVFESMGVNPSLAAAKTRQVEVARARALAAWVWVMRLGRPQVEICAAIGAGSSGTSQMLSKILDRGLANEEQEIARSVLEGLHIAEDPTSPSLGEGRDAIPCVTVVRRERDR